MVALESTILSHGLPYPQNLQLAKDISNILRSKVSISISMYVIMYVCIIQFVYLICRCKEWNPYMPFAGNSSSDLGLGPLSKSTIFCLEFGWMNYTCDDDTHTQDIIFFLPSLFFFPCFRFIKPHSQSYWICDACFMSFSNDHIRVLYQQQ